MTTEFATAVERGETGRAAGRSAAEAALAGMDGSAVDFCQVFTSPVYDPEAVVAGVREVIGEGAELIGCTSAGEFTHDRTSHESVGLALVSSDTHRFFTGFGTGLSEDLAGCIAVATADLPDRVDDYPHLSVINLHDGLAGVGREVARSTQRLLGQHVSVAGGGAGDDLNLETTKVFRDDEVASNAVALALIASKRPVGVAENHGHEPVSESVTVTETDGSTIVEIDDRPAFEVWREAIRETARDEYDFDVDEFDEDEDELARALTVFEFGIDTGDGYKIRWPGLTPSTEGPMDFAVAVPEGTVLRVMNSPPDAQVASASRAADEAVGGVGGDELAGAFVYDCFCRSAILGDDFDDAVGAIGDRLGVPFVGIESYGELCMQQGQLSGYHNATSVIMLLPD